MKRKASNKNTLKFLNNYKSFGFKLNKCERPLKRNQSGFLDFKECKSIKQYAAACQTKTNTSFQSQEFDNYYDNFLKNLQEETSSKNITAKKEKQHHTRKNSSLNVKAKRSSLQYKPFILQHKHSENNIDTHTANLGILPEIKINVLDSNISKSNNNINNIEQLSEIAKSPIRNDNCSTYPQNIKSTFNDNEIQQINNLQLDTELLNSNRKSFINVLPLANSENPIEVNKNNCLNSNNNILKFSNVSITSPKSNNIPSMKGTNILSVKNTENFTIGEQAYINKKQTKEFQLLSPKMTNHSNMYTKQYNNTNNTESNINLLNVNVMQVNPINNFSNAQKINICKNRNNSPLNTNRINKSKATSRNPSQSLRYEHDINSSFDKATKKNEQLSIRKTSTKSPIKKMSNRTCRNNNSNNNTPLLQFKKALRVPSQRNEQLLLQTECEIKDKIKPIYQEKENVQNTNEQIQTKEFIINTTKPRKFLFCIPCK